MTECEGDQSGLEHTQTEVSELCMSRARLPLTFLRSTVDELFLVQEFRSTKVGDFDPHVFGK